MLGDSDFPKRVASASLSLDEKEVYLLLNNHQIQVKDAESRKLLRTINRSYFDPQSEYCRIEVKSVKASRFLIVNFGKKIQIIEARVFKPMATFHMKSGVLSLDFCPKQEIIVAATRSHDIVEIRLRSKKVMTLHSGIHKQHINAVKVSSDYRYIASGSSDCTLALLDPTSQEVIHREEFDSAVWSLEFVNGSEKLIVAHGLWNNVFVSLCRTEKFACVQRVNLKYGGTAPKLHLPTDTSLLGLFGMAANSFYTIKWPREDNLELKEHELVSPNVHQVFVKSNKIEAICVQSSRKIQPLKLD